MISGSLRVDNMAEKTCVGGSEALGSQAEQSVKNAVSRGRKRRAHRSSVETGEIQIRSTPKISPTELINPDQKLPNVSYHKRRRVTLIPNDEHDSEDDSNDEWEEHVEIDQGRARALIESTKDKVSVSEREQQKHMGSDSNDIKPSNTGLPVGSSEHSTTDDTPKTSDKTKLRRISAARRKGFLRRHSAHLCLSICHLMCLDSAAQSDEVRAIALSIAPIEFFNDNINQNERLSILALWVRASFRLTAMVVKFDRDCSHLQFPRLCSASERAISAAQEGVSDILDVLPVLAAIARIQGVRCRIVSALQPVAHLPDKCTKRTTDTSGQKQLFENGSVSQSSTVAYGWIEVWADKKWLAIDVVDGLLCGSNPEQILKHTAERIPVKLAVDQQKGAMRVQKVDQWNAEDAQWPKPRRSPRRLSDQQAVAPKATKSFTVERDPVSSKQRRFLSPGFFSHVVAVECGMITDVSRRYGKTWAEIEKVRAGGKVFAKLLNDLGRPPISKSEVEIHRSEEEEFVMLTSCERKPTTVSAVQKHPLYILERHVKKYEVIYPKYPVVGYIKDEPIYLRQNVRLLHTRDRWIRQMREVASDAEPVKTVRSKNGTDDTVDLFGDWQTLPLIIPAVVDGKVPRGIHGNVDLWTKDHVPAGGAHVKLSFAKMAARRLNVDFAPAMTGFELRRGRSVPKIEGVVVPIENEQAVRDAVREMEASAEQRLKEKLRMEALQRWSKLLRTMKARETVRKKYGGLRDGITYEAKQKREGVRRAFREKHGLSERSSAVDVKNVSNDLENKASLESENVGSVKHEHIFKAERHVENDIWIKTCRVCGLDVTFEKL